MLRKKYDKTVLVRTFHVSIGQPDFISARVRLKSVSSHEGMLSGGISQQVCYAQLLFTDLLSAGLLVEAYVL